MSDDKKKRGYFSQIAATAPLFLLKSLVDFPRKMSEDVLEDRLEHRLHGSAAGLARTPMKELLAKAVKGRALGSFGATATVGALTAPAFVRGVDMAASKDKHERNKGVGLITGATVALQGAKGMGEGYFDAMSKGLPDNTRMLRGLSLAGSRMAFKTPAGVAMGLAISSGRKDGDDKSVVSRVAKPAVYSGLAAGGQAGIAKAVEFIKKAPKAERLANIKYILGTRPGLRKLLPAAAAAGAAGIAGGAIGSLVVDKALKKLDK